MYEYEAPSGYIVVFYIRLQKNSVMAEVTGYVKWGRNKNITRHTRGVGSLISNNLLTTSTTLSTTTII